MSTLVFDFAGVLFNWQPAQLLRRELPDVAADDVSAAHWVAQIFQSYGGDWAEYDRGTVEPQALAAQIAARTGLPPAAVRRVIDGVAVELQAMPGSVALLARLRRAAAPMYFLSNMPGPVADELERKNDFIGWFTDGLFSARVGLIKPEPAIFELAARRFCVPPAELVFIDDHGPNVLAARAAGWQAMQFVDAAQCERDLRQGGHWPAAADAASL